MSDMQHESNKKRKRRSFWEPESEKVIEWLDAQTDLGTSLQLIIVDAIRAYGTGDVIKAHLTQREAFYQESVPDPLTERPSRPTKATVPLEPLAPVTVTTDDGAEPSEPVRPLFSGPERAGDSKKDANQDMALDFDPEFELGSTSESESDDNPSFDSQDMMSDAEEKQEADYDPIAIMMNDIGSTYNK